jgi:Phasin protein
VAAETPRKVSPFDPQSLLEAQRRNFDAFTNAGQIVADGMRTYAERQVAMMQEAMSDLWSELQASSRKPAAAAAPTEQLDRMRAAFEKVVAQVQELGNLLIKVQSDALSVLNDCAAKNFEVLGSAAPDFAELQNRAKQAFEAAAKETTAVVDEMRKRMASLEQETRSATMAGAASSAPPTASAPAPKPAPPPAKPAASAKPARTAGGGARRTSAPKSGKS